MYSKGLSGAKQMLGRTGLRRLVYSLAGGAGVIACGLAIWEARGLQKELGMVQNDVQELKERWNQCYRWLDEQ